MGFAQQFFLLPAKQADGFFVHDWGIVIDLQKMLVVQGPLDRLIVAISAQRDGYPVPCRLQNNFSSPLPPLFHHLLGYHSAERG